MYFVGYLYIMAMINEWKMEYIKIIRQNQELKFTFRDVKKFAVQIANEM
jgi:hypothetical protein